MIKNYTFASSKLVTIQRQLLNSILFIFCCISGILQAQTATTITYSYTGNVQSFTVPSCVSTITIDARGAQGAQSNDRVPANSVGGLGGRAVGILTVTTGQVIDIYVGGAGNINGNGGFNGGGTGGVSTAGGSCFGGPAGGGGGASDVRAFTTALSGRVIVAGGGGGSGRDYCNGSCQPCGCGGSGGAGGGTAGLLGIAAGNCGFGYPGNNTNGGVGGSAIAGGNGGVGDNNGASGTNGALGLGGSGAAGSLDVAGGGGGGGYYGGGGGGSASSGSGVGGGGGGGGSSYLGGVTSGVTTGSFQTGNGLVILSFNYNGAGVNVATSSNSICAGTTVSFTASNVLSYTWTPGGSNVPSFTATPATNTTYTVQGTNNLGCISTSVITVTVNAGLPVLNVANTASSTGGICPFSSATLTASGATTYSWTNNVSNGASFSPTTSLTYVVTGENACGTTTAATSISVHPIPNITAVASQPTICSVNPVSITGVGNAVTYSIVNAGIPYATNFFPTATAIYTVIGTSVQGCTNTAVAGVTVVTMPTNPPAASPPLICIGSSATLSSSGATNYTWTTPGGPQTNSVITVSPLANTIYTLTKANSNCVNTQTIQLFVNQLPNVFAIVTPTLICASKIATLQGGGAVTYTWTAPNYSSTGTAPVVSPSISTMYTVTASDGTCVNTTTVNLATNPNPTINIVATSTNICQGDNVSLTANGAIGYSWTSVGVTSNTNAASITESPTVATLYQITGVNIFNCTSNQSQVVLVRTTPTITIATTKPLVCKGAPSTLTANSTGGQCTYVWDANAGSVTTSVAIVNPVVNTTYSVIGLAANGCTATQNYPVSVFLPTFAVNSPTSSCLGGTINLIASGAASYTWTGGIPFGTIPVSPPAATIYVVSATSNSIGVNCVSSNTVVVSIYQNPTVTATPSRTQICRGEVTNVNALGATTYTWNTLQTGSVVPVNPQNNTTYSVTGTDQNGCIGTATVQVKTSLCFGIDELNKQNQVGLSIYPNPNTGNFTIKSDVDIDLQLVNELGQLIKTIQLSAGNSRQMQVTDLANGIYFINGTKNEFKIREKIVVTK